MTSSSKPRTIRRVLRNPLALIGAGVIVVVFLIGLFAPLVAPFDYAAIDVPSKFQPPSSAHLFGTDQFGRDLFSRVVYGARASLVIAVASTAVGMVIGVVLGSTAGYLGGWQDETIMRVMDVFLAFPAIILGIAFAAILGPSLTNLALIIALIQVPAFARVSRSSVLAVKSQEFVTAATTVGQTRLKILLKHVLPNTTGPLVVLASLKLPNAIIWEAAFSFLGLGVQPPTPSWGNLVFDGTRFLIRAPWLAGVPALVIVMVVLSFNLLGDGVRDVLDPRYHVS